MRILIIEDEHKIANSIKQGLEQEGFAVDIAYNGLDGYDLASAEDYDLIILDLMLPGINGMDICTNLRKRENHIPIIMLTAKNETEDKVLGLNTGADDYLSKPFSFTELLARIRALLRRPNTLIPNKLECGDLKMNSQDFSVSRDGKEIILSRKEFSLLEYLLRNKNIILSKEKIIDHVWNYDSDILPNTVEVYIGYLRNKIDKPFRSKAKLIKTVRGFGYKIEDPNV
ncbi:response regulator transcription factor [Patescibacteria group bacterium]|nr:response regulator transcription factor [Patescibacteria group bacterium]